MAEGKRRNVEAPDDLANVEFETSEEVDVVATFDKMGLKNDLIRGIYSYGKTLNYFTFKYVKFKVLKNQQQFNNVLLNKLQKVATSLHKHNLVQVKLQLLALEYFRQSMFKHAKHRLLFFLQHVSWLCKFKKLFLHLVTT